MRDSQRGRVYQWTGWALRPLLGLSPLRPESDPAMSLGEVEDLVAEIAQDYMVPVLPVRLMRSNATATAGKVEFGSAWQMEEAGWPMDGAEIRRIGGGSVMAGLALARAGMNQTTVLHEMAHYLTAGSWGLDGVAHHGPEYMGAKLELLERYAGASEAALWASLNFQIPQRQLRRWGGFAPSVDGDDFPEHDVWAAPPLGYWQLIRWGGFAPSVDGVGYDFLGLLNGGVGIDDVWAAPPRSGLLAGDHLEEEPGESIEPGLAQPQGMGVLRAPGIGASVRMPPNRLDRF